MIVFLHAIFCFYYKYRLVFITKGRYSNWYIESGVALDFVEILFILGMMGYQIFINKNCWTNNYQLIIILLAFVAINNIRSIKRTRKEYLKEVLKNKDR